MWTILRKKKCIKIHFFDIFNKIRNGIFAALRILYMSYKTIERSLKTAPVAAILVSPYVWSNSAENDVTMTSLKLTYYYVGPDLLTQCVALLLGEV